MPIQEKLNELYEVLKRHEKLIVAYSGGVDSTLVLYAATKVLKNVFAVTATSSTYSNAELDLAQTFTQSNGIKHVILESEELNIPGFKDNPPDRCFHCKQELYDKLNLLRKKEGYDFIADGTNLDDLTDHRPGIQAANKAGVIHPLLEAKFSKQDIRNALKHYGLEVWDKPAAACLASRFPYGHEISQKKLNQVEKAEKVLKTEGFPIVRVRHHDIIARIEIPKSDFGKFFHKGIYERITSQLKQIGFVYVDLDLEGFRSGSMNEALENEVPHKEDE